MSRSTGFALVGCGEIGAANALSIARAAGARLVACFDPVESLASDLATQHGALAHAKLDHALDAPGVDCALICTPHDTHRAVTEQALNAGLAVLLEKPVAADLYDAVCVAKLAAAGSPTAAMLLPLRDDPRFQFAKRIIDSGGLGTPIGAVATYLIHKAPSYFTGGYSGRSRSTWRMSKRRAGGGVLIMNLFHHLDALVGLLAEGPDSVRASLLPSFEAPEVDDVASLTVRFGSLLATLVGAGSVIGGPGEQLRVWGTGGHLTLLPAALFVDHNGVPHEPEPDQDVDPRTRAIERFAAAVRHGDQPPVSIEEALIAQGVVAAAYASATSDVPIRIGAVLKDAGWPK